MNELPLHIKKAIRKYEPISTDGVTLYPILVSEYDEWLVARQAIDVLQQSFPVALMSKPLLQVYYELDLLPVVLGKNQKPSGLWGCAMLALALSMRLGQGLPPEKRMLQFQPMIDGNNPKRLKAVRTVLNGEEIVDITPVQFQRLRGIIAAQNGVKLEAEEANPELVQAERYLSAMGARLNVCFDDKLTFVAGKLNKRKSELFDWTIKEVDDCEAVFTRELMFVVNSIGGAFGGFKNGGNPTPHPFYEKEETTNAHMALSDFANGAGVRAVQNAGQQVR